MLSPKERRVKDSVAAFDLWGGSCINTERMRMGKKLRSSLSVLLAKGQFPQGSGGGGGDGRATLPSPPPEDGVPKEGLGRVLIFSTAVPVRTKQQILQA